MGHTLPILYESRYSEATRYLGDRHFYLTIFAAVALHLLGGLIWSLMPRQEVIEVPVRTLNLKLGSGGNIASASVTMPAKPAPKMAPPKQAQPATAPKSAPPPSAKPAKPAPALASSPSLAKPQPLKPPTQRQPVEAPPQQANDAAIDAVRRAFQAPSQPAVRYVREQGGSGEGEGQGGSPYGNDLSGKEVQQRYTQLLSLWLDQRKVYPPDAQQLGLQGQVTVRIRIDRSGNILQHYIARSSGHPSLDEAVSRSVESSATVPRVPERYPGGQQLEFLIPVIFSLR